MRCQPLIAFAVIAGFAFAGSAAAELTPDLVREILIREQARNAEDGFLVELTGHEDAAVRARAFRSLGRLQDLDLLDAIAPALGDPDPAVRGEAAFALGQLFAPEASDPLRIALKEESSPAVRARLAEALGKCGGEETASILAALLSDPEPEVARNAALALGTLAIQGIDISGTGPALATALRSGDPELQWRAGFAVERGKVMNASSGILQALRSSHSLVVLHAAKAARALGTRNLAEKLLPHLEHDDWRVRVEALRALGEAKLNFYASRASLLLDDRNDHVLLTAIQVMGQLASGGGLGRIGDLETSSDWRIRGEIVKAKAQGSGDGALIDVRQAAGDANWRIRKAAAEAYGRIPSEQSLMLIEEILTDESPQVQAAVVNALVSFPQIHAVNLIRPFLQSNDPAVLTSAANAAGQRYDLNAVPGLLDAYDRLQSPVDTETMVAILEALGSILSATEENDPIGELEDGDRARGEALLEAALHDGDANVARAAAGALSLIREETVEPATVDEPAVPSHLDLDLAVALESSDQHPIARLVTSRGTIVIRLHGPEAPGTVANFITLARSGYYNGLTFHRVVADFVIQGGDPRGDGWGGPGYAIRCEYNPLHYGEGTVGMALAGKDTGGSQFFITHSPQPHLDGRYTVFGEVIDGMNVVTEIQVGDTIDEIQLEGI